MKNNQVYLQGKNLARWDSPRAGTHRLTGTKVQTRQATTRRWSWKGQKHQRSSLITPFSESGVTSLTYPCFPNFTPGAEGSTLDRFKNGWLFGLVREQNHHVAESTWAA